jgi:hypothetical protein
MQSDQVIVAAGMTLVISNMLVHAVDLVSMMLERDNILDQYS